MTEKFHDIPGFFGPVRPLRFEATVHDVEVVGTVPPELEGAFYRCGPVQQYPTRTTDTIINGDGMVSMFRIESGHVDFACRYVRTERFEREHAARRRLYGDYRNPYTDDPTVAGTDRDNTANTNAVFHAGRLFALREDSWPHELDPDTLETRGKWSFDGKLTSKAVTAHPKFDPLTGEWWSHGFFAHGDVTHDDMCLQVIDPQGRLTREEWFEGPYPGLTHDFAVTREHVIFPVMPLTVDLQRLQAGGPFYAYDPDLPCCFGIMRRDSVASLRWFRMKHAFAGHIMNAYTEGSKVLVDATISRGNGFPFFADVQGRKTDPADAVATVARLTFDLASDDDGFQVAPFPGAIGEMPRCDPRRVMSHYRYGYMKRQDGIAKLDWETGRLTLHPTPNSNAGEPIFVPRTPDAAEDDGFVLSVVTRFAENRADLVILDARNLAAEPLAVARLPFNSPSAFHGSWVPRRPVSRS